MSISFKKTTIALGAAFAAMLAIAVVMPLAVYGDAPKQALCFEYGPLISPSVDAPLEAYVGIPLTKESVYNIAVFVDQSLFNAGLYDLPAWHWRLNGWKNGNEPGAASVERSLVGAFDLELGKLDLLAEKTGTFTALVQVSQLCDVDAAGNHVPGGEITKVFEVPVVVHPGAPEDYCAPLQFYPDDTLPEGVIGTPYYTPVDAGPGKDANGNEFTNLPLYKPFRYSFQVFPTDPNESLPGEVLSGDGKYLIQEGLGLSLNIETGEIVGTPLRSGLYSIHMTVTHGCPGTTALTTENDFSLLINDPNANVAQLAKQLADLSQQYGHEGPFSFPGCDGLSETECKLLFQLCHSELRLAIRSKNFRAPLDNCKKLYGIPAAPANFSAEGVNQTAINLTWEDTSDNESSFEIARSATPGIGYEVLSVLATNAESYQDTGLESGTSYYYRLRAARDDRYSDPVYTSGTTLGDGGDPVDPLAPSNLSAVVDSYYRVDLTWSDNTDDELGFRLEYQERGSDWMLWGTLPANSTAHTFSTVESSAYAFRLKAVRAGGDTDYSNIAEIVTPIGPRYNLSAFRWFQNIDSTNVGSPAGAQNERITVNPDMFRDLGLRLRFLLNVEEAEQRLFGSQFVLGAARVTGDIACAGVPNSAYRYFLTSPNPDPFSSNVVRGNDNPSVYSGLPLTPNANGPDVGLSVLPQGYYESSSFYNNISAADAGSSMLFDFSLAGQGSYNDVTYCFKPFTNKPLFDMTCEEMGRQTVSGGLFDGWCELRTYGAIPSIYAKFQ